MSKKTNNIIIFLWITSIVFTIYIAYNAYIEKDKLFIIISQILVVIVFILFIYGVFARASRPILSSMPENTSAKTLKKERIISIYKFLRIWVD